MTSRTRLGRRARWAVPTVAVLAVAGAVAVPLVSADASPTLPAKTAGTLLADLAGAKARPFSGTVVETARLGLPALPSQGDSTNAMSLLTGSHTVRIWYGGKAQTRLSLVGDLQESDLVRNGPDVWVWSSKDRTAEHYVVPTNAGSPGSSASSAQIEQTTPAAAAQKALAAIDPTTAVSVDGTARVADRAAYQLVLQPKDARSLVGSVRIAVDAKTWAPLRVQVFAKNGSKPAFETGFTAVTFSAQPASVFRFTPPPGTKVENKSAGAQGADPGMVNEKKALLDKRAHADGPKPTVVGTGWTSVVRLTGVDATSLTKSPAGGALLRSLTHVQGSFGSGRVLRSSLVSVLLLDDGTAYVGAVPPSMLEAAAATPAAAAK